MNKIDLIVVGQNYSTTLGLIQSAGEAGYLCGVVKTVVGYRTEKTPELASKYVVKHITVDRKKDEKLLSVLLEEFADNEVKRVLLPADDYAASFLDNHLSKLQKYFHLPSSCGVEGKLTLCMDKQRQAKMAEDVSLRTAKKWIVKYTREDINSILNGITYPCITKPQKSIGSPKTHIRKCSDRLELVSTLHEIFNTRPCDVLIEEYVNVKNEYTVPVLSIDDEVLIPVFIRKRMIGTGAHRGVTISGVIVNSDHYPDVVSKLQLFIKNSGLKGVFDIELFEDNNGFYFNELNLRGGAAGYALTRAGINIIDFWIKFCYGIPFDITRTNLNEGLTFMSDKAALDYLSAGYMSISEYRKLIKSSDFRFLVNNQDNGAKRAFARIELRTIMSRIIHSII